jgi:ribosomal protein L29
MAEMKSEDIRAMTDDQRARRDIARIKTIAAQQRAKKK